MKLKPFILILILLSTSLYAETLSIGNLDQWKDHLIYNLNPIEVYESKTDLQLSRSELSVDLSTDLLLSMENKNNFDESQNYKILDFPDLTDKIVHSGNKSAIFTYDKKFILKVDKSKALFSPHTTWSDFSIDFWLYSGHLNENNTLFSWSGLISDNESLKNQSIKIQLSQKSISCSFNNVFTNKKQLIPSVSIEGERPLLLYTWNHHLIRFNHKEGYLEYLINGQPVSITPVNKSTLIIGEKSSDIFIGLRTNSCLDDFRISSSYKEPSPLSLYNNIGYGFSPIYDLKSYSSIINKISLNKTLPGKSDILIYYQLSNNKEELQKNIEEVKEPTDLIKKNKSWKSIDQIKFDNKGRFLQLAYLLLPDVKIPHPPSLSSIEIDYTKASPPLPPSYISINELSSHSVEISWEQSPLSKIDGYKVYWGEKSNEYLMPNSPKLIYKNSIIINNLAPFKNYFISVKSFRGDQYKEFSIFSKEISFRIQG